MSRYIDADALKMELYSIAKADCGYTADVLAGADDRGACYRQCPDSRCRAGSAWSVDRKRLLFTVRL